CLGFRLRNRGVGRWIWHFFELPVPKNETQKILTYITGGICIIITGVFLWHANVSQNNLRAMMGMEDTAVTRPFVIAAVAVGLFLLLLFLVRLFRWAFQRLSAKLRPYVPRRVSYFFGLIAALVIFGLAANGIMFSLILRSADASYEQWNSIVQPDLEQPTDTLKSGSSASLLEWDKMGRYGRVFLARSPDTTDLKKFTDQPVKTPIRVYVGMRE